MCGNTQRLTLSPWRVVDGCDAEGERERVKVVEVRVCVWCVCVRARARTFRDSHHLSVRATASFGPLQKKNRKKPKKNGGIHSACR